MEVDYRTQQARASAEMAERLAAVSLPEELYQCVVTLMREEFGYSNVQLYRYESVRDELVLVAAGGQVNGEGVGETNSLSMAEGLVGAVAKQRKAVLASQKDSKGAQDTGDRLAAPILLGEKLLGVLVVRAGPVSRLDQADRSLITSMCGMVALGLADVLRRQEAEARLQRLSALQRMMTRQTWETFRSRRGAMDGFVYDQHHVRPITRDDLYGSSDGQSPEMGETDRRVHAVPMDVGGQLIGMLGVQQDPERPLSTQEQELLRSLSEQVTEALQRARSLEQSQMRAVRERMIRDIADRMQRATDMRSLLRTAAEELSRALGASRAYVRMGSEDELLRGSGV